MFIIIQVREKLARQNRKTGGGGGVGATNLSDCDLKLIEICNLNTLDEEQVNLNTLDEGQETAAIGFDISTTMKFEPPNPQLLYPSNEQQIYQTSNPLPFNHQPPNLKKMHSPPNPQQTTRIRNSPLVKMAEQSLKLQKESNEHLRKMLNSNKNIEIQNKTIIELLRKIAERP